MTINGEFEKSLKNDASKERGLQINWQNKVKRRYRKAKSSKKWAEGYISNCFFQRIFAALFLLFTLSCSPLSLLRD